MTIHIGIVSGKDVCDFCLGDNPTWTHLTQRFRVEGHGVFPDFVDTDGQWAACDNCHQLIVAGEQEQLVLTRIPATMTEWLYHGAVLRAFWAHRTGEWAKD